MHAGAAMACIKRVLTLLRSRPAQMDMFTTYGAGVVGRYMLSNVLIRDVGSLLIAKSFGNIRTNARRGSKHGRTKKACQLQRHQRGRLTRCPIHSKKHLQSLNIPTGQIRFAVQSDINASGSYGEEWFVLTGCCDIYRNG